MDIKKVNETLSMLAEIAVAEMEQNGISSEYAEEINKNISGLPEEVRDHFVDLWITIGRASEVIHRRKHV